MMSQIIMTEESTLNELEFALAHGINFTKHCVDELLDPVGVQTVCNKLGVRAKLQANFYSDNNRKRAYYSLSFNKNDCRWGNAIGIYCGVTLFDSDAEYEYEIEPESEEEDERSM